MLRIGLLITTSVVAAVIPPTPVVTKIQQQVMEKTRTIAAGAAPQGKEDLMKMMESAAFKKYFEEFGSEHVGKTSSQLYELLRQQLEVAEIIHTWSPYPEAGHGVRDITLNTSVDYPILFTNWQLSGLGLTPPAGNSDLQNAAEVMMYHFPNFSSIPPNYTEASDRFPYGAMNIQKIATGMYFFHRDSFYFSLKIVSLNC